MQTIIRPTELRARVTAWRREGVSTALVPTMGNLHAGHAKLVKRARVSADRVVVSIFVNPTQFGVNEDFAQYPRTPVEDAQLLSELGVDVLFMPEVADMYSAQQATSVRVVKLSEHLCGEFRPGHFEGVATIVTKLFNVVQPDLALFGEKDFQQLAIIRRLVADLFIPVQILGIPTEREEDGLAMSSRNRYLSVEQRQLAPALHETLRHVSEAIKGGSRDFKAHESSALQALKRSGFVPDYVSIRDADNLEPPTDQSRELVVLAAARLGKTRLIDNLRVPIA
jgi:pantoate--beta-alanine ligase